MIPQVYQLVQMRDEIHGALGGEAALGVVPVTAKLVAVPFFVLLCDPDELLEVGTLLVLLVEGGVDVVIAGEAHQVVNLVLDDADVVAGDGIDLAATVLQEAVLAGLDDLAQQLVQEPAVVDLADQYLGNDPLFVFVLVGGDGVDVPGGGVVVLWIFLGEVGGGELGVEGGLELNALVDGVVLETDELVLRVFLYVLPVLAGALGDPARFCLFCLGCEGVEVVAVGAVGPQVDVQLLLHQDVLAAAAE